MVKKIKLFIALMHPERGKNEKKKKRVKSLSLIFIKITEADNPTF